ncbi:2-amino-4-hydroxy-6-hydroxymethyldihydropteridine diphosphokinase [Marinilabiliaceae bacterium JC017]|nr:2-amino-4-hydroxy-6-hydroxymethyldihydropteridine diphosphokinase [Marinilabiliaceae bacterium JC017]
MKKNEAIIGIGSNINPDKNIELAIVLLKCRYELVRVSGFIRTEPIGIINQPAFLNGAVKLFTTLDKMAFRQALKDIEDELGRDRSRAKFGPREIDLDIVVWNNEIVDEDYYHRDFLQQSVNEIK